MTEAKIVTKSSQYVVETLYIAKDETIESLLFWINVSLAAYTGVFAQFQYEGSTYIISIDD